MKRNVPGKFRWPWCSRASKWKFKWSYSGLTFDGLYLIPAKEWLIINVSFLCQVIRWVDGQRVSGLNPEAFSGKNWNKHQGSCNRGPCFLVVTVTVLDCTWQMSERPWIQRLLEKICTHPFRKPLILKSPHKKERHFYIFAFIPPLGH